MLTVCPRESQSSILLSQPPVVIEQIFSYLSIKDASAFGHTCWKAHLLFLECVDASAFDDVRRYVLERKTFSLSAVPPQCFESAPFVYKVLQIHGPIPLSNQVLQNPRIAKAHATAQRIFLEEIDSQTEEHLRQIGAEPFLNGLKSLPLEQQTRQRWGWWGLETLWHSDIVALQQDKMVVMEIFSTSLRYKHDHDRMSFSRKVVTDLRQTQSGLLQDNEVLLAILKVHPTYDHEIFRPCWQNKTHVFDILAHARRSEASTILRTLTTYSPDFLQDEEILTALVRLDPKELIQALGETLNPLWKKQPFVMTVLARARREDVEPILSALVKYNPDLVFFNEEVMTALAQRCPEETVYTLWDHLKPLWKKKTFIMATLSHAQQSDIEPVFNALAEFNPDFLLDEEMITSLAQKYPGETIRMLRKTSPSWLHNKEFLRFVLARAQYSSDATLILKAFKKYDPRLLSDAEIVAALIRIGFTNTLRAIGEVQSPLLQNRAFILDILNRATSQYVETILGVFMEYNRDLLYDQDIVAVLIRLNLIPTICLLGEIQSPLLQNEHIITAIISATRPWNIQNSLDLFTTHNPSVFHDEQKVATLIRQDVCSTMRVLGQVRSPLLENRSILPLVIDILKKNHWRVETALNIFERYLPDIFHDREVMATIESINPLAAAQALRRRRRRRNPIQALLGRFHRT